MNEDVPVFKALNITQMIRDAIRDGCHYHKDILDHVRSRGAEVHSLNPYLAKMRNRNQAYGTSEYYKGNLKTRWTLEPVVVAASEIPEGMTPEVAMWFGYGAVGNSNTQLTVSCDDYHPTPVRTSRLRIWPGTSWANMEMAL